MEKLIFILAVFFLSGCPGPRDSFPRTWPAQVTIKSNQLCVTVRPEGDEKLRSIMIYELADMANQKYFKASPYTVHADECLNVAAYPFRLDTAYVVSVTLTSEKKRQRAYYQSARGFIAHFRLTEGAYGLQVEEVEPEPPNWNLPARSSDAFELISPEQ